MFAALINVSRCVDATTGRDASDRNVSPVNQELFSLLCREREGGRQICKASILLMRRASMWELRVLKEWNSDLRGKTKTEKQPAFLCLKFPRHCVKPPSRDLVVISFVRWLVPREVITLNRLSSDMDPCSYRCFACLL